MFIAFVAALLIGVAAFTGAQAGFQYPLGVALPLFAVVVFIGGIIWKVVDWAKSPVPFAIPTTGGQQRSLDWIRPSRLDAPCTKWGVLGRMLLEVLLFRSLFRNTNACVNPSDRRIVYFSSKWLWVFALLFHYSFLVIFVRHFRFFLEPVPLCMEWLEFFDGILQVGVPHLYLTNVAVAAGVLFLFGRRLVNAKVRYISLANDYFPLFLIIGLVSTGMCMRYFDKVDVAQAKVFIMGLITFAPQDFTGLTPIFFTHLAFLSVLLLVFPFSKLMHMGGVFLSPTRNLPCNTREVRHVNPWNNPNAAFRTYEEYENDFRVPMDEAGLPLDKPLVEDVEEVKEAEAVADVAETHGAAEAPAEQSVEEVAEAVEISADEDTSAPKPAPAQ